MHLNNTSHVHRLIRRNCSQLELLTGMQLVTDLGDEFEQIQFLDKLGYIIIDYQKNAILSLSHKLNDLELQLAKDTLLYLNWLKSGETLQEKYDTKM